MTDDSIVAVVHALCEEDGGWDAFHDKPADFRRSPKAEAKYGPVGLWDVSEVTRMDTLFMGCHNFNEDISAWDVRRAENLGSMFYDASSFNQPLGAWDISRVENLSYIFCYASSFNQLLGAWAVRPGADTEDMFVDADDFDLPANAPWYT